MNRHLTPARGIGALLVLQMIIGPIVNFGLLGPALSAPPGFLANAALHARGVQVATLLALVGSGCSVAVGMVLLWVATPPARALAWVVLVLAVLGFSASLLEGGVIRAMLALSQAFHDAGAPDPVAFEPMRVSLRAFRAAAHYAQLLLAGCGFVALYLGLLRMRWVPRVLAGAGVIAAVLCVVAALGPLLGGRIVMALLTPLGLCQLVLVAWLFVRGFATPVDAQEVHA